MFASCLGRRLFSTLQPRLAAAAKSSAAAGAAADAAIGASAARIENISKATVFLPDKNGRKVVRPKSLDVPNRPPRRPPRVLPTPVRAPVSQAQPPAPPKEPLSSRTKAGLRLLAGQNPLFAVVEINGSQFKVMTGDQLTLSRLRETKVGDELRLDRVLLVGSKEYSLLGTPLIEPSYFDVRATVMEQPRERNVWIIKHHRRKRYRRQKSFSRLLTVLRISRVQVNSRILA